MAGSIDNLNFEIILKDDEFGKRVQENIKLAKELNVSLTALLDLQSKVKATGVKTPNATQQIVNQEKVAAAQKKTAAAEEALAAAKKRTQAAEEALAAATARRVAAEQRAVAATARSVNAQTSLQRSMNRTTSAAKMQAGLLGDLKGLALQYLSIRGVASFISSLVRVTGEFELQKTTLAAMLGDLSQAQAIMSDIKGLAVQSPFQFKELATYAKQLTAFAVPAEQLFETTKMLADVSAGLGVGMDRIVLAYGQVKSAAFLRGQEVRQFTEAGIPILNMLAKQFEKLEGDAVSVGEVFDRISARMVSFEMVNQVFKDLTSEGGKFYKMQETQAETLRGKISNLTDAYEIMLNEMGSKKSGFLKGSVDSLRNLMTHWEAVGKAITAVVVALGVYKGTLAAIAVAEKIAATKALVHKWQLLNSVLKGMGKNVSKMKTAWMVFGNSAKTAMGLAGAAAGALLAIIIANVSKIGELKRELNNIVGSEALKSETSVSNLKMLVQNLEKATEGSQEYRDIIAQLNKQYGDYLPKVLEEAEAYRDVANAAIEAEKAIKAKARASAFERGQEEIESKYSKNIQGATSTLMQGLINFNPSISEDVAVEFIQKFRDALAREGGREDVWATFKDTFNEYFGSDAFARFKKIYTKSTSGQAADALNTLLKNASQSYSKVYERIEKEEKKLNNIIATRFQDATYNVFEEREKATKIEDDYRKAVESADNSLKKKVITQKDYNKQIRDLDVKKFNDYISLYKSLDRQDLVDYYQDKLDALKVPEGWRGLVQGIIEGKDLDKYSSFGLWAEETTNSVDYVEDMVKRYKELKEQIDLVQPFDDKQANRLKQNKELIEEIAKALGLDIEKLAASKKQKGETEEEKRLKRLISALRKLQDQYEKLKAVGASDESIKKLFEVEYPDLIAENGKEFVTDLKYLERGIGLAKELSKIDANAGKKALVDLGADSVSLFEKEQEKEQKAFKEAAKAAEEYFNILRAWEAEDFNIQGKGIIFDVNKITSDLQGAINKIELKATKLKETFAQIIPEDFKSTIEVYAVARIKNKELAKQFRDSLKEIDSDDIASIYKLLTEQLGEQSAESIIKTAFPALKTIQESFTKEFGADAWTAFWEDFKTNGSKAIDFIADKEKASEKAKSQEKLNDLARKYIKESYFNNNIKLEDLGDKDYFQIRTMRKRLQELLEQKPLTIPVEVQNLLSSVGINANELVGVDLDAFYDKMATLGTPISESNKEMLRLVQSIQKAKLSTEDFGNVIKKVVAGDLKDLTKQEGEELMSMVKDYMNEMKSLLSSISEYAESIGDDDLQGAIKGLSESISIMSSIGEKLAQGDWIGAIISGVTSLTSVILEAASAEGKLAQAIEQTRNEMQLLNSQRAINSGVESFFGTDDFKKFQNAMGEAVKAHDQAIKDIEKQNQILTGHGSDDWGAGVILGGAGAGAAIGAAVGSVVPVIGTAIGALGGALIGLIVGSVGYVSTEVNNYADTLKEMAESIGADLINEQTGALDVETLEKIKETYTDLDEDSKAMLDNLIANARVYENAVTEIATFMTDIFGQCAESMADSFIESFKQSGEAALEYGDLMDALATDIARSMIKSVILQNVFSEEDAKQAAAQLAAGNAAGAMEIVDKAIQSAEELAPYIQELLKSLEPYFNMSEESQNLADGIKGMTEDTANLLASYLNAIRADVSYAKSIWERMDKNTQAIASAIASFPIPSLMEYQAQIAANTYNTAMHTQDILFELRSVIASDGGPTAIRVLM